MPVVASKPMLLIWAESKLVSSVAVVKTFTPVPEATPLSTKRRI